MSVTKNPEGETLQDYGGKFNNDIDDANAINSLKSYITSQMFFIFTFCS